MEGLTAESIKQAQREMLQSDPKIAERVKWIRDSIVKKSFWASPVSYGPATIETAESNAVTNYCLEMLAENPDFYVDTVSYGKDVPHRVVCLASQKDAALSLAKRYVEDYYWRSRD